MESQLVSILGFAASILTSIVTAAAGHGIMKEKVRKLEADLVKHETQDGFVHNQIQSQYVTYKHFEAILGPVQAGMQDMQRDLKAILSRLTNG